jgi:branched-chain amino acid transport system permease protein
VSGDTTIDAFLSQLPGTLLDGLIRGLAYVGIALGLTIVFGMLRLVNFAHGAFYLIGAYVGLVVSDRLGLVAGLIVAPIAVAIFAVIIDYTLLRRFYDRNPTSQILITFGIALVVQEALRLIFTGTTRSYTVPAWLQTSLNLGFTQYPTYRIVFAIGIVVLVFAVWFFIERTNYGLIVRAGIRDRTMVQLLGGNVRQASTVIFALGGAIAGLVGAGASPIYSVDPNTGFNFLVPSFVVIVIGGLGSFWGAVVGGLLVGELQSLTTLISAPASDIVIYVAMAIVLLVRPSGLFGESEIIRG